MNRRLVGGLAGGVAAALALALGISASKSIILIEYASMSGVGMGTECATTNPTGTKGEPVFVSRTGVAECVSGDGQTVTQIPTDTIRVKKPSASSNVLGFLVEDAAANRIGTASRDASAAAFTKTSMTCTRTAPGMRGNDTNGATTCTATANNGTVTIAVSHTNFAGTVGSCGSVYVKRRTGSGTISVTYDGSVFTDITSSVTSSWKRVAKAVDMNYDTAIFASPLCALSSVDVVFGIKLGTSGDAVDLDFWQVETNDVIDKGGSRFVSLSPIELVDATPIARHADILEVQMPDAGFGNQQGCLGYTIQWGDPADRYACPQFSTTSDGGFFAYYDIPPNFWMWDGVNNPGPVNDGVTAGAPVSTFCGWSGGNGGTMVGGNSNGDSLSSAYNGRMLGGGAVIVIGSQAQIAGNVCYANAVINKIRLGSTSLACHW